MPLSEKIMQQLDNIDATPSEKALVLGILQIEEKGAFRFQSEYESLIKKYIAEKKEE